MLAEINGEPTQISTVKLQNGAAAEVVVTGALDVDVVDPSIGPSEKLEEDVVVVTIPSVNVVVDVVVDSWSIDEVVVDWSIGPSLELKVLVVMVEDSVTLEVDVLVVDPSMGLSTARELVLMVDTDDVVVVL